VSPGLLRALLGLALLASVAAAWYAPADGAPARAGTAKPDGRRAAAGRGARGAPPAPALDVLSIRRRVEEDEQEDGQLFTPAPWATATAPVPAPAVAAAEPAEPAAAPEQAPLLPFRVLGQYEQAGQTVVFLQHGELNLLVRVGDTIAEQYKVESLVGNAMSLRYIPSGQLQTLEVGTR
jgi:hypothetical protein